MQPIDMSAGWTPLKGYPGLEIKYLANDMDESQGTGARTRFVRFAPGTKTTRPLIHTYWEEVYLLSGDMYPVGEPRAECQPAPLYSLRPPGTPHGPFASDQGCLLFEVQYFVK
jgi:hypothetical protein